MLQEWAFVHLELCHVAKCAIWRQASSAEFPANRQIYRDFFVAYLSGNAITGVEPTRAFANIGEAAEELPIR